MDDLIFELTEANLKLEIIKRIINYEEFSVAEKVIGIKGLLLEREEPCIGS